MSTSKTWPGGAVNSAPAAYTIPASGELNWPALSNFLNALGDSAQSTTFQKFAVRKCLTTPVTVSASSDCVIATQLTSPAAVAVNLPAGADKQIIIVVDSTGDAGANPVTITRNGSDTIAGATTATITSNNGAVMLVYNASDTDWKLVRLAGSASSGSGEKNYIANPSTATGWTASGAGITVTTDTTAAELPRPNTTFSGIKFTGVSGSTAYGYYRFILDDADVGKKMKLQFDMKPGTAVASDFKIDVYTNTASDYSTGNARLSLSTDVSAVSALPALTGTYRATFDAPALTSKWIEVRVGMNASATHTLVLSDFLVGPGIVSQGAALSDWVSFTPTGIWSANTTYTGQYRRVGSNIEVMAHVALTGAPTGSFSISLPTGLTINTTTLMSGSSYYTPVGLATGTHSGLPYLFEMNVIVGAVVGDSIASSIGLVTAVNATTPITWANGDFVDVIFSVPVNEWAGSGTVNIVQNDSEYVYNSSGLTTANTSDTTSFAYGSNGAALGSVDSTATTATFTTMRVRFLTPIQVSDRVVMEIQETGVTGWIPVETRYPPSWQGTARFGCHVASVSGSTTDLDIRFGNGGPVGTNTTYAGASTVTWSTAGIRWRVRKTSGGQAIGFSEASTTSLGLVKPSHTALAGAQNSYSAGSGLVRSGTYTPTLANVANVASSVVSANSMIWAQIGQVVTCSGYLTTTETAGGPTDTQFTLTLPVVPTTNFAQLYEAGGTCASKASVTVDNPGQVYATTSAKTVTVQFAATVTTATRDLTYIFQYLTN